MAEEKIVIPTKAQVEAVFGKMKVEQKGVKM